MAVSLASRLTVHRCRFDRATRVFTQVRTVFGINRDHEESLAVCPLAARSYIHGTLIAYLRDSAIATVEAIGSTMSFNDLPSGAVAEALNTTLNFVVAACSRNTP